MAALVFVFRSGDCLTLGAPEPHAQKAYELILSAQTDLVSLEAFESFPKFAVRRSEIAQLWLDPNDHSTVVGSTALTGLQTAFGLRDLCFAILRGLQANSKPDAAETPSADKTKS